MDTQRSHIWKEIYIYIRTCFKPSCLRYLCQILGGYASWHVLCHIHTIRKPLGTPDVSAAGSGGVWVMPRWTRIRMRDSHDDHCYDSLWFVFFLLVINKKDGKILKAGLQFVILTKFDNNRCFYVLYAGLEAKCLKTSQRLPQILHQISSETIRESPGFLSLSPSRSGFSAVHGSLPWHKILSNFDMAIRGELKNLIQFGTSGKKRTWLLLDTLICWKCQHLLEASQIFTRLSRKITFCKLTKHPVVKHPRRLSARRGPPRLELSDEKSAHQIGSFPQVGV